ncbi:efflux RND transporter periplasmic adaptor subunit [Pygmaiobacter massiliensis]|uniref:efflux RND transporter periplasmic adaptor subunit n=1 Tax=Pygmaiobacter massiliensis TaxID=1917873 RepID=UPI000C7CCB22|nr:hypothetical protein [Pygmaiobacter massiliensis]
MQKKKIYAFVTAAVMVAAAMAPVLYSTSIPECEIIYQSKKDYAPTLQCSGMVIPSSASKVSLSTPLFVKQTYVRNGSYVTKGQKLFDVDREKMVALAASGADDGFAALEGEDFGKLVSVLGSMDQTTLSASVPEAVYATDNGTVVGFSAEDGAILAANSTVCSIAKGSTHQLRLTIPEDQLGRFAIGSKVVFSPVAYSDREYYGELNDLPANVRRQLTTTGYKSVADIYVTVDAADEYLTDGMSVTAKVLLPQETGLNILPYEAVSQDEEGEFVYTVENGHTQKRYIMTGREFDDGIEICAGLQDTEGVVANAQAVKASGELVRVH